MTENAKPKADQPVVLTEEDLKKSIAALEGKKPDEKPVETPAPRMREIPRRSFARTLDKGNYENLQKAIDVSEPLAEMVSAIGTHVDSALEDLRKSTNAMNERDLAFVNLFTEMKKSIDALAAKVEAFGNAPAGRPASSKGTGAEILRKAGDSGSLERPKVPERTMVLKGLESLAKSLPVGTPEQQKWSTSLIRFESASSITDADLSAAVAQYKKDNGIKSVA